jgi:hypothetical protein
MIIIIIIIVTILIATTNNYPSNFKSSIEEKEHK